MPRGARKLPRNPDGTYIAKDGKVKTDYYARRKAKKAALAAKGQTTTLKDFNRSVDNQLSKAAVALGKVVDYDEVRANAASFTGEDENPDVKRLRENIRDLSNLTRDVTRGNKVYPEGFNPSQAMAVYETEAKSLGINLKHLSDSRTEAEKAQDAVATLLSMPSDMLGILDGELDAMERAIDLGVTLCHDYLDATVAECAASSKEAAEVRPEGPDGGADAQAPAGVEEADPAGAAHAAPVPEPGPVDGDARPEGLPGA